MPLPSGVGANTISFAVPNVASLAGRPVVFQVFNQGQGLSRPVLSAVVP